MTLYLILNLRSDCYWRPDREGYTRDLSAAGLYTGEESRRLCRSEPENRDVAIPLSERIEELYAVEQRCAEMIKRYESSRSSDCWCGHDERNHETIAFRGDRPRACLHQNTKGKLDCDCRGYAR